MAHSMDGNSADETAGVEGDVFAPFGDGLGFSDEIADDLGFANTFSEEIENVTASDWDVDAEVLWGDDASLDLSTDPSSSAFDFPV